MPVTLNFVRCSTGLNLMREYNRIPAANENEKKRVLDMLVGAAEKMSV